MAAPKKQWRMRRSPSGAWSGWTTMQNNFQYEMGPYDRVEFRDDPGPCQAESPFTVDGSTVTCERQDATHKERHMYEYETYDTYGNYSDVELEWEKA